MEQLKLKIMTNRCLCDPKLHNCALFQIVYVSKYTREALCCIPSLGFELEPYLFYRTMIILDFFMVLPSKTMDFLGFSVKHCLCKSTILRHGYRGAVRPLGGYLGRGLKNHKNHQNVRKNVSRETV